MRMNAMPVERAYDIIASELDARPSHGATELEIVAILEAKGFSMTTACEYIRQLVLADRLQQHGLRNAVLLLGPGPVMIQPVPQPMPMPRPMSQPFHAQSMTQPCPQPTVVRPKAKPFDRGIHIPRVGANIIMTDHFKKLVNTLGLLADSNIPVLLKGEAGSGKNQAIFCLAAERKMPVIRINCSGDLRTSSLLGRMVPTADNQFTWQDGFIPLAIREGCYLVLDEINALEADILFSLHGLLDEGKLSVANNSEVVVAHEDFRLFATMNPSRYFATKPLNQALLDRLAVVPVDYDQDIDSALIDRLGLDEAEKTAFNNLVGRIRVACMDGQIGQNFGHRTLDNIARMKPLVGLPDAIEFAFASKLEDAERAAVKSMIMDFTKILNGSKPVGDREDGQTGVF